MQFKDHPGSASSDLQAEQNHNQNPPSDQQVRTSRATMVEAVSHKLTSLFTAIIGNVELAFMALGEENLATLEDCVQRFNHSGTARIRARFVQGFVGISLIAAIG